MSDNEERSNSPPLPRGAYNINFDDIDLDAIDPFKPRGGIGVAANKNPFVGRSKLSASPPLPRHVECANDINSVRDNVETEVNGIPDEPDDLPPPPPDERNEDEMEQAESRENESAVSEPLHFEAEENPFKQKSKIARSPREEMEPAESVENETAVSEPINIEAEENPFKRKSKIARSPRGVKDENLSKSGNELAHSPSNRDSLPEDIKNPFQSGEKLGRSPPSDYSALNRDINNDDESSVNKSETVSANPVESQSQTKAKKGLKTKAKSKTPTKPAESPTEEIENVKTESEDSVETVQTLKAATSPKKSGIKKPKAKSKFKPPANFGAQNTDEDVVIFAPPPPSGGSKNDLPMTNEKEFESANPMTVSEIVGGAGGMIDSVHDFGAADMPVESNEDFVAQSEAFEEGESWGLLPDTNMTCVSQMVGDVEQDLRNSFEVPDKVTSRRASEALLPSNSEFDDDEMSSPPPKQSSARNVSRHPAARALQEQVGGEVTHREAHIADRALYGKGYTGKPYTEGDERYFDAPEYPLGARHQGQGDEVDRMKHNNMKNGSDHDLDSVVQFVPDTDSTESGDDKVLKYSQSDWNKMKQELELEYNTKVLNKEREWGKKLADRDKKIAYLDEQVLLLRSANEDMKLVVTEFEKTIAQLQADKLKSSSESQNTFGDVIKERDQALEDLQSVETAFSDLHQRYERTKGVVEGFKKNEEILKKCVQDYQDRLKAADEKMASVIQQAEDKLARASDEMEKLRKSTSTEVARLEAATKKADLKIQGLQRSLEQKIQENSELTAICDELIAKVGD
ncbi:transforming acidic coiled-coil-containing protein 3-like isoform X12 [Dreissena polymorpha]|uniref:transforming acidic coiled-coil-containing protein 3-like isoform X10 n=1 Tax=Dreissena polymorpha TaxID=45954 RepID=UPI0022646A6F|nr:transforming acidic coiled-coil-containing protein 3-like isoform X10 [Dreissena polymorpha]XP_052252101.1 transforming acidic coiled-coil-containing protein 3-like isoform X11 [Dreissena polymorpha]XP_052252102.1 transforming acidic coiled-coil-containing protein 3-like isoform X12 [Dreissena polymorpha]